MTGVATSTGDQPWAPPPPPPEPGGPSVHPARLVLGWLLIACSVLPTAAGLRYLPAGSDAGTENDIYGLAALVAGIGIVLVAIGIGILVCGVLVTGGFSRLWTRRGIAAMVGYALVLALTTYLLGVDLDGDARTHRTTTSSTAPRATTTTVPLPALPATAYTDVQALRTAFIDAGGRCPDRAVRDDDVSHGIAIDCNEDTVAIWFRTARERDHIVRALTNYGSWALIVGPNWVVNTTPTVVRAVQPRLGGEALIEWNF